jgi:hypothetical protein
LAHFIERHVRNFGDELGEASFKGTFTLEGINYCSSTAGIQFNVSKEWKLVGGTGALNAREKACENFFFRAWTKLQRMRAMYQIFLGSALTDIRASQHATKPRILLVSAARRRTCNPFFFLPSSIVTHLQPFV